MSESKKKRKRKKAETRVMKIARLMKEGRALHKAKQHGEEKDNKA
jgi:hypothetical protein